MYKYVNATFYSLLLSLLCLFPSPLPTTITHTHQAQNANETGDYDSAKRLGQFSLGWNVGVYIFYVLATIAWIVAVAVIVSQAAVVCSFGVCVG